MVHRPAHSSVIPSLTLVFLTYTSCNWRNSPHLGRNRSNTRTISAHRGTLTHCVEPTGRNDAEVTHYACSCCAYDLVRSQRVFENEKEPKCFVKPASDN